MSNPKNFDKFSTVFESMDSKNRNAKEAGLSKEESIAFEKKEFSKVLHAATLTANEDEIYGVIRSHVDLFVESITHTNSLYA